MERMNFIMFCLGAGSLMVGMIVHGPMKQLGYAIKSSITHRKNTQSTINQSQMDDLQEQVNNLAERLATRETNRRNNVRREIRDYLKELQTK